MRNPIASVQPRLVNQIRRFPPLAGCALAMALHGSPSKAESIEPPGTGLGREIAVKDRLADDEEFALSAYSLISMGRQLFEANWTVQEGGGRPLTKGTGLPLSVASEPLVFPRAFNRLSAPDANSCAGCHNLPGPGGNGDVVANVFVLGQRFDFARFDGNLVPTHSATDESGQQPTLDRIANSRATPGMFGSGYIEMLARQMTTELQARRDTVRPGFEVNLVAKGVDFGILSRLEDGSWMTSQVVGIPAPSLASTGPDQPPSLIIRPFHQAGNVISLRQFTVNALNHHHGIQPIERFGADTDPDGDGWANEITRAEVTALTLFQATMAVPGRVIPRQTAVEQAILRGEQLFDSIGCAVCHIPSLPLDNRGWIFTEPNPFNPTGNANPDSVQIYSVDLSNDSLPHPRLKPRGGIVQVPAFTDLKLHDITSGPDDPNVEALDMNQPAGSPSFFAGNRKFITRKLWGAGSKPNFFHHGQYTTLREATLAHAGEAIASRTAFESLPEADRNCVIEFLKSLRLIQPSSINPSLAVDERGVPREWPTPTPAGTGTLHGSPDRIRTPTP